MIYQRTVSRHSFMGQPGDLPTGPVNSDSIITVFNDNPRNLKEVALKVKTTASKYVFSIWGYEENEVHLVTTKSTKKEIAQEIADKVNQSPLIRGFLEATVDNDTVKLKTFINGFNFKVTSDDSNLEITTTQDFKAAGVIPFGRVLFFTTNKGVKLPDLDDIKPGTLKLTPIVKATTAYKITLVDVEKNKRTEVSHTSGGSDDAATIANGIKSEIEGAGYDKVKVVGDALEIEFDDSVHFEFEEGFFYDELINARGIHHLFAGIAVSTYELPSDYYPAHDPMMSLRYNGEILVEKTGQDTRGDRVFVETKDGPNKGKVYNTPSETRVFLPMVRFLEIESNQVTMVRVK